MEVIDDSGPAGSGRQPREHAGGEVGVRMHDVGFAKLSRQACGTADAVGARHVQEGRFEALGDDLVEKRPGRGRDEGHLIAAVASRACDLHRDQLAAGDVAARDELDDPHGRGRRQTATSSDARSIPSRSIAIPSSVTSAIGAVPTRREARRRNVRCLRSPSMSTR